MALVLLSIMVLTPITATTFIFFAGSAYKPTGEFSPLYTTVKEQRQKTADAAAAEKYICLDGSQVRVNQDDMDRVECTGGGEAMDRRAPFASRLKFKTPNVSKEVTSAKPQNMKSTRSTPSPAPAAASVGGMQAAVCTAQKKQAIENLYNSLEAAENERHAKMLKYYESARITGSLTGMQLITMVNQENSFHSNSKSQNLETYNNELRSKGCA